MNQLSGIPETGEISTHLLSGRAQREKGWDPCDSPSPDDTHYLVAYWTVWLGYTPLSLDRRILLSLAFLAPRLYALTLSREMRGDPTLHHILLRLHDLSGGPFAH